MNIEDLGEEDFGDLDVEQPTKIALIDADTIAFAAASVYETAEELLPRNMYSDEEWASLVNSPNYDAEEGCIWHGDIEASMVKAIQDVRDLISETNCIDAELHFSTGRNFRYDVFPEYKGNRVDMHYPQNNRAIKIGLLAVFNGTMHEHIEADDMVVRLKQDNPDKYVLCAVDKDVLNAVAGKHYNYYRSDIYNIARKWMDIDYEHAFKWPYKQCLMGDSTDNIKGCPGIGKVKAEKALSMCNSPIDLWKAVVSTFKSKKLTEADALMTMRLVSMMQAQADGTLLLWEAPNVDT